MSNQQTIVEFGFQLENIVSLTRACGGSVFYVNSSLTGATAAKNNIASRGKSPSTALYSIDYAVGLCTASRGDLIVVMPGHVETVATAAALALDVAGITVIGLGRGSLRPIVNFTATAGTATISAANIHVENIIFNGAIDAVAAPLTVSAADCTLRNIEYRDASATQCTIFLTTTASADRLLIDGLVYRGDSAAGTTSAIAIVGGDGIIIRDFSIVGNFSTSAIDVKTTATTNIQITDGYIWTKNSADLCIKDTITGSTGRIGPNLQFMLTDNAANITESVTGATFHLFSPIIVCNLAGEQGMAINTTTSTDA